MTVPKSWQDCVEGGFIKEEAGPRTAEQNAKARQESVAASEQRGHSITKFTCDDCPFEDAAEYCPFIYDHYNTDGDCLALK